MLLNSQNQRVAMGFEVQDVERKALAIMKILKESDKPLGARVITRHLKDYGIELGERAVRYHLKLMDEKGLTRLLGQRDGRILTEMGAVEVDSALVEDKVGFAISKIDLLAFRTTFDAEKLSGQVPINISFFPKDKFKRALDIMRPSFEAGLAVSDMVAVAPEGEKLGDITVPRGKTGLATVCSIIFNGALLKNGIPVRSRFGGILQIRNHSPLRFVELIDYAGCTLDPATIFIRARMTSVSEVAKLGEGRILANFREIPAQSRVLAEEVIDSLERAGIKGILVIGDTSEPVCEIPVELGKNGIVLLVGLNPVAAAEEAGIESISYSMSTLIDYQELFRFQEL
ncbi:MAG TPA: DUF128 domain-containing protein [Dehalococcoidia bacterium]|nr:DUF128 domain-containing protein [Dehalococcoidia bacterium]